MKLKFPHAAGTPRVRPLLLIRFPPSMRHTPHSPHPSQPISAPPFGQPRRRESQPAFRFVLASVRSPFGPSGSVISFFLSFIPSSTLCPHAYLSRHLSSLIPIELVFGDVWRRNEEQNERDYYTRFVPLRLPRLSIIITFFSSHVSSFSLLRSGDNCPSLEDFQTCNTSPCPPVRLPLSLSLFPCPPLSLTHTHTLTLSLFVCLTV